MILAIGGHASKIGKTALAEGIIRALPDRRWTAIKISKSARSAAPVMLMEELSAGPRDTGRFLEAGASRAFWLRTPENGLPACGEILRQLIPVSGDVLVESGAVTGILKPDLFLMLLNFQSEEFKASAGPLVERADAFVVVPAGKDVPLWASSLPSGWNQRPQFAVSPPDYVTAAVPAFVESRFSASCCDR